MKFTALGLEGAYLIEVEPFEDERGIFGRTFCRDEFREHGLRTEFVQCSTSWNGAKGTLRGMHYQRAPSCEAKLVRCTSGAAWDVIVDMRPDSETYLRAWGGELSSQNRRSIYVPEMFAHGFLTLAAGTEIHYQISKAYSPECSMGCRYDDPSLGIDWPEEVKVISTKDQNWPLLSQVQTLS